MAEKKELNPSPKFPSGDYPELSPNPNQREGLVNKTGEQPNTQFVNPERKQEKRCLTVSEVVELILKYAPKGDTLPEVTSADNEKVLEVIAGAWAKGNKKVNVIDAPTTPFSANTMDVMSKGIFINGIFNNYRNPIVFPFQNQYPNGYSSMIMLGGVPTSPSQFDFCAVSITPQGNINNTTKLFGIKGGKFHIYNKDFPVYPSDTAVGQFICRKGVLEWYNPVAQNNITSGDVIALDSTLGKALLDHLEVEINGFRARYEYTSGNYVVYSSKSEVDSGLKLQINMISYNTTNGELSFNQMTFTPDA